MAVYEIFSHPEYRRYKTQICTKATILQIFIVALTFIPPLLIAYRSQGFWQRIDEYYEQPAVNFKHELLVILDTKDSYLIWSTYQNLNQLVNDKFRVPLIKSREEDTNRDGKFDQLRFQLDMPLLDTEEIFSAKLLLVFDYKLFKYSTFQMESLGYIAEGSAKAGAALEIVGDLRLKQRSPLSHRGTDTRFNASVIDGTSIYAQSFQLSNVFEKYSERNVTTELKNMYPVWVTGRAAGKPFSIKATIRYPEERIVFMPGLWQLLKFAWVQYLAILLIFIFLFNRIKIFIFQNQLVTTVVERPFKQKVN